MDIRPPRGRSRGVNQNLFDATALPQLRSSVTGHAWCDPHVTLTCPLAAAAAAACQTESDAGADGWAMWTAAHAATHARPGCWGALGQPPRTFHRRLCPAGSRDGSGVRASKQASGKHSGQRGRACTGHAWAVELQTGDEVPAARWMDHGPVHPRLPKPSKSGEVQRWTR